MALKERQPSLMSRLVRKCLIWCYRSRGWTATGQVPEPRRFVLIAAPHTSNWDFLYFIGLTEELGIMPHFMAKKSLFRWPWKKFISDMGGVPIDRSVSQNYVQAMIDEFGKRSDFMLTIAPEGTRSAVRKWKTGFYQIALGAQVPMVVGMMDYAKKSGGLGPAIWPTGDFKADMAKVAALLASVTPRHPDRKVTSITGEGDE